jgi:DnaK suppressor protein
MGDSDVGDMLHAERAAALARLLDVEAELGGIVASSVDANADDEHDPEGSTIAFERAQVIARIGQTQTHLDDLDHALARLSAGSYGVCEGCRKPIAPERLAALPAVRTCFDCANSG